MGDLVKQLGSLQFSHAHDVSSVWARFLVDKPFGSSERGRRPDPQIVKGWVHSEHCPVPELKTTPGLLRCLLGRLRSSDAQRPCTRSKERELDGNGTAFLRVYLESSRGNLEIQMVPMSGVQPNWGQKGCKPQGNLGLGCKSDMVTKLLSSSALVDYSRGATKFTGHPPYFWGNPG